MFSLPVSFVGFRGEPRRYPRATTSYRISSPGGWTYHESGGLPPHALGVDPFFGARPTMWSENFVPRKRTEWTENVVCHGFSPDEVTLKVSADKVFIHCIHKDGDDENSDTREKKKTVMIPDDVESGDITADMSKGGTLTLKAPYVQKEEPQNDVDVNKDGGESRESNDVKKETKKGKKSSKKDGTTNIQITRG